MVTIPRAASHRGFARALSSRHRRGWRRAATAAFFLIVLPASRGDRIAVLKPLYPDTELTIGNRAACLIVTPTAPALHAEAENLAQRLEEKTRARPDVVLDETLVSAAWQLDLAALHGRQIVALGTINNNRLLAVLWGEGYTAEDDAFPGPGGFVVRTVQDPFALGLNVVELAASDPTGLRRAADAFLARHVKERGDMWIVPGPVVEVQRGAKAAIYPDLADSRQPAARRFPSPAEFAADLDRRVTEQHSAKADETKAHIPTMVNVTNVLSELARAWFFTGDPGYPPVMKQLIDRHRDLLQIVPQRAEMEAGTADDTIWWDLVEELPVWTDQDRRDIVNALLADARQGHEKIPTYELVRQGYVQTITENHGTNSALHTYDAWRYFVKYYRLPEENYWLDVVHAVFNGQLASHQVLEDSASYLTFSHQHDVSYALESRDLRFFSLGIARSQMEFDLQCSYSNLGLSTGFGDCRLIRFPNGYDAVARIGWVLQDPRAAWWWRVYLPERCNIDTYSPSLPFADNRPLREPTEFTGLRVLPIYRQALGRALNSKTFVTTPAESAGPEWFNKIVFRAAWSPEAQYLLLDGAGVWRDNIEAGPPGPSGHNHNDINTIITLTDRGRLWLVDHTYAERAIQDHSGLTITRNGAIDYKPALARLENAAESGSFAITRTVFPDFSGANWERTIFWRRGDHFVVLDRAVANQPGKFNVRCDFRALGEDRLRNGELRLSQQGRFFQIRSDGESRTSLETFAFPEPKNWRAGYRYAEPVAKIFEQYKSATLARGQAIAFANLLKSAAVDSDLDRTSLSFCRDEAVTVAADGQNFVYGLNRLPGDEADCDAFAVASDALLLAGCRRLGPAAAPLLSTDAPIDLSWAENKVTLRCHAPATVTLSGRTTHYDAGEHIIGGHEVRAQFTRLARRAVASAQIAAASRHPASGGDTECDLAKALPAHRLALGTDVRHAISVDLDGDGAQEWIATGAEGLSAFSATGALRWRFAPGQPCGALAAADLDGDGREEIAVGCDDTRVYLVDRLGHVRWKFACKPTARAEPPVPDQIAIADLDGDGRKEIIVAANYFHCLEPDGRVLWEDCWTYFRGRHVGDAQSFAVADLAHDGRMEVVGAYVYNYSVVVGYNADGKRVYPRDPALQFNHQALGIHRPNVTDALNLFGDDGGEQIVIGTRDQLEVRWTGGARDTKRAGQLPGGIVGLTHVIAPGEQRPLLVTADSMHTVLARQAVGERAGHDLIAFRLRWQHTFDGKISALWSGRRDNRAIAIVGLQDGKAFVIDAATGTVLGCVGPIGAAVVEIVPQRDAMAIVGADGEVALLAAAEIR